MYPNIVLNTVTKLNFRKDLWPETVLWEGDSVSDNCCKLRNEASSSFALAANFTCFFVTSVSAVWAVTERIAGTCLVVLVLSDRLAESAGCMETDESSSSLENEPEV